MSTIEETLPHVLQVLANPVTPHTAPELWSRIRSIGWTECLPILLEQLRSGSTDVQRLVMDIVSEEAEQMGVVDARPFIPSIILKLGHEDRLVRISAISTLDAIRALDSDVVACLLDMVQQDESAVAREALIVLLRNDGDTLTRTLELFRSSNE